MGILNLTPDSFSDGGRFTDRQAMDAQIDAMVAAGADIIDVGGESTRPYAEPVAADEELARVLPAIEAIRRRHSVSISIDTTKATVARRAIEAGADIINDVSALRFDPEMAEVARRTGVRMVLMHMQGTPRTMQERPHYQDVVADIRTFLKERIDQAMAAGIPGDRLIVDPGIGFGKTVEHNLSIIKHIGEFATLGCPVLIGHSRKAFIGTILDRPVDERDRATAVLSALCVMNGAAILRVHDVAATAEAVRLAEAVKRAV